MRLPERRRFSSDHSGTASLIAFLVATSIFVVSFGIVIQTSVNEGQGTPSASDTDLQVAAARLAETVLGSGAGWYSTLSCSAGTPSAAYFHGDSVTRVGLGRETCPGTRTKPLDLAFDKIATMNGGKLASDAANGYVDYPEARASLGLGEYDFHIRSWPVLGDVRTLIANGARDPNERVAYLGAYTTLAGEASQNYVVQKACGKTDGATTVDLWVDITNNGTASADFEAQFTLDLADDYVEFTKHTGPVLPGATTRLTATITKTADWVWKATPRFDVEISDSVRGLGSCNASLVGVTMTAASTNPILVTYAERTENVLSGGTVSPKVYYAAYDGEGDGISYNNWKLEIQDPLGLPVATDTNLNNRGWESFPLTLPLAYQAVLKTTLETVLWSDTVNVLTATVGAFTPDLPVTAYVPDPSVVPEMTYLAALTSHFDPNVYSATYTSLTVPYAAGGDVYPDLKSVLNYDLTPQLRDSDGNPTLATYNILVVGSSADHNAMTSATAKQTIRDWVFAGGYLMVMGSQEQAVNWLQPIFHSAISSASSPLGTPDSTHPLLHTPNALDYANFDDQGRAWSYNSGSETYFGHVIASGANDILSVSNTGAFGKGRVLLTSYEPWDIAGSGATGPCDPAALTDACPALHILHNFLTYAYKELYMDYGPPLPTGSPIGAIERVATVYHPELAGNVEIIIIIYVF